MMMEYFSFWVIYPFKAMSTHTFSFKNAYFSVVSAHLPVYILTRFSNFIPMQCFSLRYAMFQSQKVNKWQVEMMQFRESYICNTGTKTFSVISVWITKGKCTQKMYIRKQLSYFSFSFRSGYSTFTSTGHLPHITDNHASLFSNGCTYSKSYS